METLRTEPRDNILREKKKDGGHEFRVDAHLWRPKKKLCHRKSRIKFYRITKFKMYSASKKR